MSRTKKKVAAKKKKKTAKKKKKKTARKKTARKKASRVWNINGVRVELKEVLVKNLRLAPPLPGADITTAEHETLLRKDAARHFRNAAQDDRTFDCIGCGDPHTPKRGEWCFHFLCPFCFGEFDHQKMEGRFGKRAPYFESAERWVQYRRLERSEGTMKKDGAA
jgi:hypothetical protein